MAPLRRHGHQMKACNFTVTPVERSFIGSVYVGDPTNLVTGSNQGSEVLSVSSEYRVDGWIGMHTSLDGGHGWSDHLSGDTGQ